MRFFSAAWFLYTVWVKVGSAARTHTGSTDQEKYVQFSRIHGASEVGHAGHDQKSSGIRSVQEVHGHSVPSPVRSPLICSSETSACIAIIKLIRRRGKFGNFTSSSIYLSTKSTLRYLADKEGATDMILWTTHKSHLSLSLAE